MTRILSKNRFFQLEIVEVQALLHNRTLSIDFEILVGLNSKSQVVHEQVSELERKLKRPFID